MTNDIINEFKGRKISKETLIKAGVKSSYRGKAIAFNYFDEYGKIVNAKYRSVGQKKMWQHANAPKRLLYGLDVMLSIESNDIVICEGEYDSLSWVEVGKIGLSLSQGAPAPGQSVGDKLKCLENSAHLLKGKNIYIAVDNDEPGRYLEKVLINRFGYECKIIGYPDGCKDSNDVLVKYGPKILLDCFDRARCPKIEGLTTVNDVRQKMRDILKHGYKQGETFKWQGVDDYIKFTKGTWSLWFGMANLHFLRFLLFESVFRRFNSCWAYKVYDWCRVRSGEILILGR